RLLPLPCSCARAHPALHSFPTRRSSDLTSCVVPRMRAGPGPPSTAWVMKGCTSGDSPLAARITPVASSTTHAALRSAGEGMRSRSEEHTSELQSRENLVCRLLLEKKKKQ